MQMSPEDENRDEYRKTMRRALDAAGKKKPWCFAAGLFCLVFVPVTGLSLGDLAGNERQDFIWSWFGLPPSVLSLPGEVLGFFFISSGALCASLASAGSLLFLARKRNEAGIYVEGITSTKRNDFPVLKILVFLVCPGLAVFGLVSPGFLPDDLREVLFVVGLAGEMLLLPVFQGFFLMEKSRGIFLFSQEDLPIRR